MEVEYWSVFCFSDQLRIPERHEKIAYQATSHNLLPSVRVTTFWTFSLNSSNKSFSCPYNGHRNKPRVLIIPSDWKKDCGCTVTTAAVDCRRCRWVILEYLSSKPSKHIFSLISCTNESGYSPLQAQCQIISWCCVKQSNLFTCNFILQLFYQHALLVFVTRLTFWIWLKEFYCCLLPLSRCCNLERFWYMNRLVFRITITINICIKFLPGRMK